MRRLMRGMIVLMLLAAAGHVVVVGALARWFIHPPRSKVRWTPAHHGLAYRDVTVRSPDGVQLKAWYVPGTSPAGIVLCHGFPGCRADLVDFLPWLHRAGFHVLA